MLDVETTFAGAAPLAEIAADDVRQVVADVFQAMLAREIDTAGPDELTGARLNACVQITGAWQGAIVIETNLPLARLAASIIFEVPVDQVQSADINDALAELVNMIGGNIKALLPGPSVLSLPAVTEGCDFLLSLPGARLIHRACFDCQGERLELLICEKALEAAGRKRETPA